MLLKNKTTIITGCNKGIGKKILEVFSENKANIFACVRKIDKEFETFINEIVKKNNNEIIPIKLDLNNEDNVKEASNNIINSKKPIDILVNNAGTIHTALFQMTTVDKLKEMFNTNFFSQTIFTQNILKSMIKKRDSSIIYISSTAAIDGNEGRSAYSSTKSSLIAQAKVLSREVGRYNIRVNTIAPGLTNTDMMKNNTPQKFVDELKLRTSLKRIATPEEIANVALFLASDLSSYITGQTIRVDGGMHF
ncbi:MAG: SDR family oxidoreductase [Pelagibacterales bacterium]|nr:SDR family oxidoreductase [Pelagibacterales bacterium]